MPEINTHAVNRRREERYRTDVECELMIDDIRYSARFNDISLNGASVILKTDNRNIKHGDELNFLFLKENFHVVNMVAVVRNISSYNDEAIRLGLEIIGGRKDLWEVVLNDLKE
jgi:hypothetical protein